MKAVTLAAAATAAVVLIWGAAASAQVQVVDSNNRLIQTAQAATDANAAPAGNSAELFYQLQMLQQEVLELRGLVEEQAYELRRLKQQRLDDYLDLDRRVSALTSTMPAAAEAEVTAETDKPADATATPSVPAGVPAVSTAASAPNEMQRYRTAIDLVLRKKDYDQAITAFNHYLRDFPSGRYAANCQYWLGEIFLLRGDLEQAREWFSRLLSEYSDHNKVPDATYKLGTVYDKLGDTAKARELLQQVAAGNSNAARLATNYLSGMGNP
ncbi:tol-pal system protein YbgF [Pseudomaricurvus alkylphenolicus]|uniref:tol-pal system protein YbgF n=1 Tax=Pseudomaricurvus alkylphenolicus TaxID=1306991 RepID=UPI001420A65D|nr:tol-pal system protein YbgF [Pseudomaricurvus alkylphenolicus]NIB42006.1 tol-pal system protein YbgF [Pseudomaricurvus alkylphenolicus]